MSAEELDAAIERAKESVGVARANAETVATAILDELGREATESVTNRVQGWTTLDHEVTNRNGLEKMKALKRDTDALRAEMSAFVHRVGAADVGWAHREKYQRIPGIPLHQPYVVNPSGPSALRHVAEAVFDEFKKLATRYGYTQIYGASAFSWDTEARKHMATYVQGLSAYESALKALKEANEARSKFDAAELWNKA